MAIQMAAPAQKNKNIIKAVLWTSLNQVNKVEQPLTMTERRKAK